MGHSRHFGLLARMSALPPIATAKQTSLDVGEVPCMDGARGAREKSGISAKRSGAAMYSACFAWRITSVAMQPLWPLALM
jgi:hypothetical protein